MKKKWNFYLGLFVSCIILVTLFVKIPFTEVIKIILEFNPYLLIASFSLYFIEFFIPAIRFCLIGRRNSIHISLKSSYVAVFIGSMGNYILPARAGEIIKTLYLEKLILRLTLERQRRLVCSSGKDLWIL